MKKSMFGNVDDGEAFQFALKDALLRDVERDAAQQKRRAAARTPVRTRDIHYLRHVMHAKIKPGHRFGAAWHEAQAPDLEIELSPELAALFGGAQQ